MIDKIIAIVMWICFLTLPALPRDTIYYQIFKLLGYICMGYTMANILRM